MGEIVQPEGFLIPLDKIKGEEIQDISSKALHWPESIDERDERCEEIEFKVKATPELEKFFMEQSAIIDATRSRVECFLDGMACDAVNQRFPEKSKEERNELYEFANLVARCAWNACYEYHKAMIER